MPAEGQGQTQNSITCSGGSDGCIQQVIPGGPCVAYGQKLDDVRCPNWGCSPGPGAVGTSGTWNGTNFVPNRDTRHPA